MLSADHRAAMAWMEMNREEAHRLAEPEKLRRLAGLEEQSWFDQQRCWLLCRLGRLLVALGERLEQYAIPQSVPIKG
jgi:hypothetical protein